MARTDPFIHPAWQFVTNLPEQAFAEIEFADGARNHRDPLGAFDPGQDFSLQVAQAVRSAFSVRQTGCSGGEGLIRAVPGRTTG